MIIRFFYIRPRFIVSLSLDPRLWVCPNIGSCTPTHAHITPSSSTLPLIFRGCAFSELVSLTIRIYSSMASPSILGFFAPSSLASSTNRLNHRISDTWLSPSISGPQWHVRRRGFGLAPLVRKKSAMVTRNIEAHGLAHSL